MEKRKKKTPKKQEKTLARREGGLQRKTRGFFRGNCRKKDIGGK